MDWVKSSASKANQRATEALTFRTDRSPTKDYDFSNDLVQNLKKNYEARLQSLESSLKETYQVIDNDEVIRTMKNNQVSDEFRRQRIQEIAEDALLHEKEVQIEKLNHVNAILKTEIKKIEEDRNRIKQVYQEEVSKFQTTISEFETIIESEARTKNQYKLEYETLSARLTQLATEHEELIHEKDAQLYQHAQSYQQELNRLKAHLEDMLEKGTIEEQNTKRKDNLISEMQKDMEIFRREYSQLEFNYNNLASEHNNIDKRYSLLQEATNQLEFELNSVREVLRKTEEELRQTSTELKITLNEKTDLINKTDYISNQVKKIVETEQKASSDMVEDVKRKYKEKMGELKKQITDLQELNDSLSNDLSNMKYQLDDTRNNHDRVVAQLHNDMKVIKNEWDKKCQEIDLNAQRNTAELKAKHQLQINQLQAEYQTLLDKRLTEIQNEANSQINKTKSIDMEIKAQLESRIAQIEKDYILKTKHENILTTEVLDLKTKHAQETKELEDKFEREFGQKIREINDKNKLEYEAIVNTLKAQKQILEQDLLKARHEIQKIIETASIEREKVQRLQGDLEDSERSRKDLLYRVDEANQNLAKLRTMYDEESRKTKRYEGDSSETRRKLEDLSKKSEDFTSHVATLKNEIVSLNELKLKNEEKIDDLLHQLRNISNENEHLKYNQNTYEKERSDFTKRIRDLNEELSLESQKIIDAVAATRREENEKLEEQIGENTKLQTRLTQSEARVRHLTNDLTDKDKKIVELRNAVTRLENFMNELQGKCLTLESDLAHRENINRDLQKKIERQHARTQEGMAKVRKFLSVKLTNLRSDISSISNSHALEIEMNRKAIQGIVTEILRHFKEKFHSREMRAQEDKEQALGHLHDELEIRFKELELARVEEKVKDKANYERILKGHLQENELLQSELENLKTEVRGLASENDELTQTNLNMRAKLEKLDRDNANLREINQQKVDEFEKLQNYVQKELRRIKDDSQTVMESSILQIEEQHEKDLKSLFQVIESLKETNIWRLKKFDEEISKIHTAHLSDINQMKTLYETRIADFEKEISLMDSEIRTKKREITNLKTELDGLRETYAKLREENQKTFATFEEKIESFKQLMKVDNDKYMSYKSQTSTEIERYKRELKETQKELSDKNQKIEDLGRIKEDLKTDMDKYRSLLLQKDRAMDVQQKDTLKISKHRDREIEELQSLLNKSMASFGGSRTTRGDKAINIIDFDKK